MTERVRPAGDGRASGATRVTHVLGYYPPHIGGMEQRVQELCSALSARGHDVSIATSDIGGMTRGRERVDGVAINRYHGWDVGVTPFVPFMLLGLLRAPKPDLYHIHIAHAGITEIGYLVARLRRRPYIVQVRMSPRPSTRFGVLLPLYRLVLKGVLQRAALVLVATDSFGSVVRDEFDLPADQVVVIPNGTRFSCGAPVDSRPLPDVIRLLTVGRLAVQKNVFQLLKLITSLDAVGMAVTLDIVGDGELRPEVEAAIRSAGLGSRVRVHGSLTGSALVDAYQAADVFIMASSEESFGSVLLEAMAHGLPVIAKDVVGVRDVVTDGLSGILVADGPESVASFVSALGRLVGDPELRDHLIAGGFATVAAHQWPLVAERIASIYQQILAELTKLPIKA